MNIWSPISTSPDPSPSFTSLISTWRETICSTSFSQLQLMLLRKLERLFEKDFTRLRMWSIKERP
ncbi:hypothetical protein Hanom_Chr16g01479961 [Helianthus anomalus]